MNTAFNMKDEQLGKKDIPGNTKPKMSETQTMRAVTWQGKRKLEVKDVPKPMITDSTDAIVRVTALTICSGSDLHPYNGEIPNYHKGTIPGHECLGIIESVGKDVNNFDVGQKVVVAFNIACGSCEQCLKKNFTGCETTNNSKLEEKFYGHGSISGIFGYGELLGGYPGTQAEYVRVPYADTNLYPVPDDVPDEKALYVSDVMCTSLHGVESTDVGPEDVVCIFGLGPIGLNVAQWCKVKGAKRIVGIDSVPERLALAREKLGIEVVDRTGLSSTELCGVLEKLEPKGFNVAIECVGFRFPMNKLHKVARKIGLETDSPEIIDEILTCIKQFGRIFILGDYAGICQSFPIGKIMFKNVKMLGSGQCPTQRYMKYVMEKIQDGTVDPTLMITHRFNSLDAFPEAYEKLDKKEDGYIKIFVSLAPTPTTQ